MVPPAVGQGKLGRSATYLNARVCDLQVLSKPDAALATSRRCRIAKSVQRPLDLACSIFRATNRYVLSCNIH